MNHTCPNCGYPLHRTNHPWVKAVRFCRMQCVRQWMVNHGKYAPSEQLEGLDRRRAA